MNKQQERITNGLAKHLTDRGLLIEAGFEALRHYAIPKDAPKVQVDEMRLAFMSGAQHVFGTIMNILDPGEEPTDADMNRMSMISSEIEAWEARIKEMADRKS